MAKACDQYLASILYNRLNQPPYCQLNQMPFHQQNQMPFHQLPCNHLYQPPFHQFNHLPCNHLNQSPLQQLNQLPTNFNRPYRPVLNENNIRDVGGNKKPKPIQFVKCSGNHEEAPNVSSDEKLPCSKNGDFVPRLFPDSNPGSDGDIWAADANAKSDENDLFRELTQETNNVDRNESQDTVCNESEFRSEKITGVNDVFDNGNETAVNVNVKPVGFHGDSTLMQFIHGTRRVDISDPEYNEKFDDFIILEQNQIRPPKFILRKSAELSKMSVEITCTRTSDGWFRGVGTLNNEVLADVTLANKECARKAAAFQLLSRLRKFCWTIKAKASSSDQAPRISKDEILSEVNEKAEPDSIASDNVGYQMLCKMGWRGGGIGKDESGIVEPISLDSVVRRAGLGSGGGGSKAQKDFRTSLKDMLKSYALSDNQEALYFSSDLGKEERRLIYDLCRDLNLDFKNKAKNADGYIRVGKKNHGKKLLEHLMSLGGETYQYVLLPPGSVSAQQAELLEMLSGMPDHSQPPTHDSRSSTQVCSKCEKAQNINNALQSRNTALERRLKQLQDENRELRAELAEIKRTSQQYLEKSEKKEESGENTSPAVQRPASQNDKELHQHQDGNKDKTKTAEKVEDKKSATPLKQEPLPHRGRWKDFWTFKDPEPTIRNGEVYENEYVKAVKLFNKIMREPAPPPLPKKKKNKKQKKQENKVKDDVVNLQVSVNLRSQISFNLQSVSEQSFPMPTTTTTTATTASSSNSNDICDNNGEDYSHLRDASESNSQWRLRRKFLQANMGSLDFDHLISLSQCFVNMVLYKCKYPPSIMEELHEMSHGILEEIERERQADLNC